MAVDYFLQMSGIPGESTDPAHKGWIDVLSFSQSITQTASATGGAGGGVASGGVEHQDFAITKNVDLASPQIYLACASGKHLGKVVVEAWRSSGASRVKYLSIEIDNVIISKVTWGTSGTALPTESVTFVYGKITWTYTPHKPDGSAGNPVTTGWDLALNKAV
jgi:type VI secretion system Hcp family effector